MGLQVNINRVQAREMMMMANAQNFDPKSESGRKIMLAAGVDEEDVMRIQVQAMHSENKSRVHSGSLNL